MTTVKIAVTCDYPPKEVLLKLASTALVSDLRSAIAKSLEFKAELLNRYQLLSVTYGTDAVDLSGADAKTALNTFSIGKTDVTTIFVRAPPDVKPFTKRIKKDASGKTDEKKTEAVDKDRYKGLSVKTIWKALDEANDLRQRKIILEFIDIYIREIVATPQFARLPKDVLAELLRSDGLSIDESALLEGVIAWVKRECRDQKLDDAKSENYRRVLGDLLYSIRFASMSTEDIAVKVASLHLLDPEQTIELYTFLGTKANDPDARPGKSLAMFNNKPRVARRPPVWFMWDNDKKTVDGTNAITIRDNGTVVTSIDTGSYMAAYGNCEMTRGVWQWELVINQMYPTNYSILLGVVPTTFTDYTRASMIGYSGHVPGWSISCYYAQKYDHGRVSNYGNLPIRVGDIVRLRVDLDKKTFETFVNGVSRGMAFTNVVGPVRPALSFYGNNSVTLQFPK